MGLYKNYINVGQNASKSIFGISRGPRSSGATPLSMLISQGAKFNNSKYIIIILSFAFD